MSLDQAVNPCHQVGYIVHSMIMVALGKEGAGKLDPRVATAWGWLGGRGGEGGGEAGALARPGSAAGSVLLPEPLASGSWKPHEPSSFSMGMPISDSILHVSPPFQAFFKNDCAGPKVCEESSVLFTCAKDSQALSETSAHSKQRCKRCTIGCA